VAASDPGTGFFIPVNMDEFKLSTKQQTFLDHVINGENIFLTGKAGTGKSHIVNVAIDLLKRKGKNVVAIAPTGIAATNVNGQTIHSMFSLRPFGVLGFSDCNFIKSEKRRMLQAIDTIFIDEISMLRPDILDAMHWTLIKNGCKGLSAMQIIFIGDLKQLPAVLNDNTRSILYQSYYGEEFFHACIYEDLKPVTIELDEVLRQTDTEFITHLNLIREGTKSPYFKKFVSKEIKEGIILAPHNSTVSKYNHDGLAKLTGEEYVFTANVSGNAKADEFNIDNIIKVKHGAKIMYLANSKNNNLINGTLGTFIVHSDQYFISVGGVEYALAPVEFSKYEYVLSDDKKSLELKKLGSIEQYPIRLAYALSIHKSQGLTFDKVNIDLSLPCFSKGQLYVALSRVRTPDGLTILVNR
jgi:ATP-dependent exoDNAse (exonuclease V) alpha subunit